MNPKYEESLRLSKEWLASHTKEELEEMIKDCPKDGPTVEEYFQAIQPRGLPIILESGVTPWGLCKRYTFEKADLQSALNGHMSVNEIEEHAQHVIQIITFPNMYISKINDTYCNGMAGAKVFNNKFDAERYCHENGYDLEVKYKVVPVFDKG